MIGDDKIFGYVSRCFGKEEKSQNIRFATVVNYMCHLQAISSQSACKWEKLLNRNFEVIHKMQNQRYKHPWIVTVMDQKLCIVYDVDEKFCIFYIPQSK